jgi:hypothetical protein
MAALTYRVWCPTAGCEAETDGYVYCFACRQVQTERAKRWYRAHRKQVLAAKKARLGRPRRGLWKDAQKRETAA